MSRGLEKINHDIDAVEAQLRQLENAMDTARIKKKELDKERDMEVDRMAEEKRQRKEQEAKELAEAESSAKAKSEAHGRVSAAANTFGGSNAPAPAPAAADGSTTTPADSAELQARIAQLQMELQQVEEQKNKIVQSRSRSPMNRSPARGGGRPGSPRASPGRRRSPTRQVSPRRGDAPPSPSRAKQSVAAPPLSPAKVNEEEYYEEEVIEDGAEEEGPVDPPAARGQVTNIADPPASSQDHVVVDDTEHKKKTAWKKPGWVIGRGGNKKVDKAAEEEAADSTPAASEEASQEQQEQECPSSPSPGDSQPDVVSPYKNEKNSAWEKPAWANAAPDAAEDAAVDTSSINNPFLKPKQDGYQRKVFAKDLAAQNGHFVKEVKKVEPRLTWIVVRINDDAVKGKIVMHLHGMDVHGLVDKFVALEGQEIERKGTELKVFGEPNFYITLAAANGLDRKKDVYGVVQEGQDIVEKLVTAGPEAKLSIKQAHIFPVKKSKKGL